MVRRASFLLAFIPALLSAQVPVEIYEGMQWRSIGPFRGGRSLAVAGSVQRPQEYFFGATGGGVWKTTDGGTTWNCVSDGYFRTASVGALAIAPSDPDLIVAGTGEKDIRGNISHGDGVYISRDAGKTWVHAGLKEAQTIARIVIHPTNPQVMYVAALGKIYGKSPERGVYKTTDGGKTWSLILAGALQAGAVDVELDPTNPEVVLASIWDAWRTPYTMNSGGPNSKLYKSTNGGASWDELSDNPGMPSGVLGKIGVTISPADPKRYWAIVENLDGGIFRSDDAGATWTKVNSDRNWRQRAWYYSHVIADPKDKEGIYVLNVGWGRSADGGKTFRGLSAPHSDHHDLWIDPTNPKRMINANDGGANVSTDGGMTWTQQNFATAQFYHVSTDNAFPYRILGAQQDNSTVRIPSRTTGSGIRETDWTSTAGGESGYVSAKPDDPEIVFGGSYGGDLSMLNHRTGERRAVDPWPDNPMGHGAADLTMRFQWTFPIVFSPHNANVLYTCSQFVLRSTNMGQTWVKISPDLTRNDKSTMGPSGGPITKDNTSVEYYGTVFTLAESPKRRGVLWAGSDDGLIHVSQNGGRNWTNVTPKGMPEWGLVSMIEASPFDPATAYAAVDNHENDDLKPYIYITRDYGKTWKLMASGIDREAFVRVVREDQKQPGLLYAGTETGMYVSFNAGGSWQPLQMNLPLTPIHDIAWKEDDLVVATHGRSFWVLDDVSPLQQLAKDGTKAVRLFAPRDAVRVRWGGGGGRRGGGGGGAATSGPAGANPPSGVIVNYYLPADAKDVKAEFLDGKGTVVGTVTGGTKAGFNRISGWMQYPAAAPAPGMILWNGFSGPIPAPPGQYMVRLTVDGAVQTAKFRWKKDPRLPASDADLVEQTRFAMQVRDRVAAANQAVVEIRGIRAEIDKKLEAGPNAALSTYRAELVKVEETIYQTKNQSGQDPLNYPIRLNDKLAGLLGVVLGAQARPTDQSYAVFKDLNGQLEVALKRLDALKKENGSLLK